MCPAPRALEIRREDANRPTTAPGVSRDRARLPLGKASRSKGASKAGHGGRRLPRQGRRLDAI
jgi:hypothetical protein